MSKEVKKLYKRLLDRPLPIGSSVQDRYRITSVLGMGSFGISYLCEDDQEKRRCVVKQVKPSRRKNKKSVMMYERETSIMKELNHPGIPKLLDRFQCNGHLFFAMDYIDGKNLEDIIFEDGMRFTEKESLSLMRQLLTLVEYVHARGIVHRDLRLPNVIKVEGQLYLVDFGLARYIGEHSPSDVDDDNRYSSEKKLRRQVDVGSDFYAMGHFLLYLLYSAYEGDDDVERSWEDELSLHPNTKKMLKRLLQMDTPYENDEELRTDLDQAVSSTSDR